MDCIAESHFCSHAILRRIGACYSPRNSGRRSRQSWSSTWCLAGDNAIVIALAARNLPGTCSAGRSCGARAGAVIVRSSLTVGVLWLLGIPG
jgi:hypothetical protein